MSSHCLGNQGAPLTLTSTSDVEHGATVEMVDSVGPIPFDNTISTPTDGHGSKGPTAGYASAPSRMEAKSTSMTAYGSSAVLPSASESNPPVPFEKFCEICGGGHNGSFGSGRFCSLHCACLVGGLAHKRRRLKDRESKERNISKKKGQRNHRPTQDSPTGMSASLRTDTAVGLSSERSEITGTAVIPQPFAPELLPATSLESTRGQTPNMLPSPAPLPAPGSCSKQSSVMYLTPASSQVLPLVAAPAASVAQKQASAQTTTRASTPDNEIFHFEGPSSASLPDVLSTEVAAPASVLESKEGPNFTAVAPCFPPFLEPSPTETQPRRPFLSSIFSPIPGPHLYKSALQGFFAICR